MIESIGTMITTTCGSILPFYLSEAETESYPYAVYEHTLREWRDKDGVYQITAEGTIRVYSKDFDEAQQKADQIKTALESVADDQYVIRPITTNKDCTEDVWVIELSYFVKQTR